MRLEKITIICTIEIKEISITDLDIDAIVNTANDGLWIDGGICGAIFKAAGHEQLQAACNKIGHCDTGSAVITPGFDLKSKYIIHAVGPRWLDGYHREPELLYNAYKKALELALDYHCRSIGFPLISAGTFGCPIDLAWGQAVRACTDFINEHSDESISIIFAVLTDDVLNTGREKLREITGSAEAGIFSESPPQSGI